MTICLGYQQEGLDSLKCLLDDFGIASYVVATNTCSLLFQATRDSTVEQTENKDANKSQDDPLSLPHNASHSSDPSKNFKLNILKAGYDILEITRLDKKDWAREIFSLVEELLRKGEKEEAEEICSTLEAELDSDNQCLALIIQLLLRSIANHPVVDKNDSLNLEDEILVSSIQALIHRKMYFQLFFHVILRYMYRYAEIIIKNLMKYFQDTNSRELGCKATETFIEECVLNQKPDVILGLCIKLSMVLKTTFYHSCSF